MKTFAIRIVSEEDPVGQGLGVVEHIVHWETFEHLQDVKNRAKELASKETQITLWMQI